MHHLVVGLNPESLIILQLQLSDSENFTIMIVEIRNGIHDYEHYHVRGFVEYINS